MTSEHECRACQQRMRDVHEMNLKASRATSERDRLEAELLSLNERAIETWRAWRALGDLELGSVWATPDVVAPLNRLRIAAEALDPAARPADPDRGEA